jgi:two-component system response regulator AtoC
MDRILIAEDEPEVRNYLGMALRCHGFAVDFAQNGDEALQYVRAENSKVSLVLLDIVMPSKDGLQTLQEIRESCPDLPVIMLSGAASPVNVVTAMRSGAIDFLPKPVGHQELYKAIQKALPTPLSEAPAFSRESGEGEHPAPVTGLWCKKMDVLLSKVGLSEVPVLLQGETGVGKEVLARKLHAKSVRAGGPFLKLNCAALPSELVESELFGYERGAFTGAFKNTPGKFEMANGGTILLDEIGDMDLRLQAKLLQVLQDREFLRLGSKEVSKVDVRVMAATHRDLQGAIVEGVFREDLYYRLNVVDIHIPPLRERVDEILRLAEFFVHLHATPNEPRIEIPPVLRRALLEYRWPGNVRELENVMRKYLVLRNAEALASDLLRQSSKRALSAGQRPAAPAGPANKAREIAAGPELVPHSNSDRSHSSGSDFSVLNEVDSAHKAAEADAIVAALNGCLWNRKQAAVLLNVDYKALLYKMKKLGIGERKASTAAV